MAVGDSSPLSIIRAIGESALSRTERLNERVTALYEAQRDGVYRFLVAEGIAPPVAQEITQDVFVKLFIALRDGVEIVSEQGWLYSVAAKSAVDHWRRQRTPVWVELDMKFTIGAAMLINPVALSTSEAIMTGLPPQKIEVGLLE